MADVLPSAEEFGSDFRAGSKLGGRIDAWRILDMSNSFLDRIGTDSLSRMGSKEEEAGPACRNSLTIPPSQVLQQAQEVRSRLDSISSKGLPESPPMPTAAPLQGALRKDSSALSVDAPKHTSSQKSIHHSKFGKSHDYATTGQAHGGGAAHAEEDPSEPSHLADHDEALEAMAQAMESMQRSLTSRVQHMELENQDLKEKNQQLLARVSSGAARERDFEIQLSRLTRNVEQQRKQAEEQAASAEKHAASAEMYAQMVSARDLELQEIRDRDAMREQERVQDRVNMNVIKQACAYTPTTTGGERRTNTPGYAAPLGQKASRLEIVLSGGGPVSAAPEAARPLRKSSPGVAPVLATASGRVRGNVEISQVNMAAAAQHKGDSPPQAQKPSPRSAGVNSDQAAVPAPPAMTLRGSPMTPMARSPMSLSSGRQPMSFPSSSAAKRASR